MPLYEYFCEKCNHECEVIQKYNDDSPICEKCFDENRGVATMTKKISTGTSFILKGQGWFKTDYPKK